MSPTVIDSDKYPILAGEAPEFLEAVARFAGELDTLSEDQKRRLALFKAAELLNALMQLRERDDEAESFGTEKAAASFKIVRAVVRDRRINFPSGETVALDDPEIRKIIDTGCQAFHAGKRDPEQQERAMALSTAQCIVLHPYLKEALDRYVGQFRQLYPDRLVEAVERHFIEPYKP